MTNQEEYDEILARLSPAMRQKVRQASTIKNERLALPSIGLTKALEGGLRYGSQTMLWGNRSGGKTGLALGAIKIAQADGRKCVLIEPEKSFTDEWGKRNGVNTETLVQSAVGSIADCTDLTIELMRAGVDVVVIDSISSLLPGSYFDDGDLKVIGGTNQIGQFSRDIGKMTAMFNYVNEKTALIMVSQIRTDLSGYHAALKPMGGKAMEHFNSTSVKLWASVSDDDTIKANVSMGDHIYNKPVGRKVTWTADKARGAGMGMTGKYDFYFDGPFVGVDIVGEVLDLAVAFDVVEKNGSWYNIFDYKGQGKEKAVAYLRNNVEVFNKIVTEVE